MTVLEGRRAFLSGPMSGREDWNRAAFAEARERCLAAGAAHVFDPAHAWGHDDRPSEWYMLRDLHELTRCDAPYDVLVQLDGWDGSSGAVTEFMAARACGIECAEIGEVAA